MTENTQETETFHSQNVVLNIALGAKILAWAILVLYIIDLVGTINSIYQQWSTINLPPGIFDQVVVWSGLLDKPFTGLFYFLALQGLAQLLYIGLDAYLAKNEVEEAA